MGEFEDHFKDWPDRGHEDRASFGKAKSQRDCTNGDVLFLQLHEILPTARLLILCGAFKSLITVPDGQAWSSRAETPPRHCHLPGAWHTVGTWSALNWMKWVAYRLLLS